MASSIDELGDKIIDLVKLILVLVVFYVVVDSVATHVFDFPLPGGIG